ncbi:MAG TPA: ATP-binding protein [Candidatus Angelobacter sp.]|jgi:DNA replication protein DnaC
MSCGKCHGGFVIKQIPHEYKPGKTREVAVRCECSLALRQAALLKQSRIPERYVHGFKEYDPNFGGASLSLGLAKNAAIKFAEEYQPKCHGMLFVGPLGVGKTHLACSALRALVDRGIPCLFYAYADLLTEIKDTYNEQGAKYWTDTEGNRWETESQILNHVVNVEVLLLDELGKVKASDWVLDKIREIIGGRYDKQRTTIVTTNFLLDAKRQPGVPAQITLQEKIGSDMVSRLREMCRVVPMEGVDFRQAVKAVNFR